MSQLFTKAQAPVETPAPQPPATMPDPQSPSVLEAKRKAQIDIMGRAGRSSTILTAPENRGGGTGAPAPYIGKNLGAA